jgi:hypothetical protein
LKSIDIKIAQYPKGYPGAIILEEYVETIYEGRFIPLALSEYLRKNGFISGKAI